MPRRGPKSCRLVVNGERLPLLAVDLGAGEGYAVIDGVSAAVGSKYSSRLWRSVLPPKISQRSPAVMVRAWLG